MNIQDRLQKLERMIKAVHRKPAFILYKGAEPNQDELEQIEQATATGNRVFVYTVLD